MKIYFRISYRPSGLLRLISTRSIAIVPYKKTLCL